MNMMWNTSSSPSNKTTWNRRHSCKWTKFIEVRLIYINISSLRSSSFLLLGRPVEAFCSTAHVAHQIQSNWAQVEGFDHLYDGQAPSLVIKVAVTPYCTVRLSYLPSPRLTWDVPTTTTKAQNNYFPLHCTTVQYCIHFPQKFAERDFCGKWFCGKSGWRVSVKMK